MNKTTYISIVLLLIGVMFTWYLMVSNENTQSVISSASVITVDKISYDFGEIEIFAGKVSTDYTLTNIGEVDVTITSAITSCMCTEGEIGGMTFGMREGSESVTIPAGGSETLTAIYDPLAHGPDGIGKVKRELTLKTNSTETPEIIVTFTADVYKD